jgi:hypothetical protein
MLVKSSASPAAAQPHCLCGASLCAVCGECGKNQRLALPEADLCLHLARSLDQGLSWQTELLRILALELTIS